MCLNTRHTRTSRRPCVGLWLLAFRRGRLAAHRLVATPPPTGRPSRRAAGGTKRPGLTPDGRRRDGSSVALVHLIRHGQASFGAADYDQLSPLGAEQGGRLAARLSNKAERCTHVFCGSLRRHHQTYEAVRAGAMLPDVEIDKGWDEFDFVDVVRAHRPDFENYDSIRRWAEQHDNPSKAFQQMYVAAVQRWSSGEHDGDYRETRAAFVSRVYTALDSIANQLSREDIALVFTSGGPISVVIERVLELREGLTRAIETVLVNAGLTTLSVSKDRVRLLSLNDHGHLETGGEPIVTYR